MSPNDNLDPELSAIKKCLKAIQDLDSEARKRVVGYLIERIGVDIKSNDLESTTKRSLPGVDKKPNRKTSPDEKILDIRSLKEKKEPETAIEMAVLIAYYLSEYAPIDERRSTVSTDDLENYFKQAAFPLPSSLRDVLPNAKKAGYMDNVSRGEYKLTPVGYNLAVHGLPKS
jgi:hypothetical protein